MTESECPSPEITILDRPVDLVHNAVLTKWTTSCAGCGRWPERSQGGLMDTHKVTNYEPPAVRVLGTVQSLTQSGIPLKQYGGADGAMFSQQSVSWAS